jgi:hypothetical protein
MDIEVFGHIAFSSRQGFFPQGFPLAIYHATYILKLDTSVADEDISFNGKGECGRTGA